jgi:hypothetical protein
LSPVERLALEEVAVDAEQIVLDLQHSSDNDVYTRWNDDTYQKDHVSTGEVVLLVSLDLLGRTAVFGLNVDVTGVKADGTADGAASRLIGHDGTASALGVVVSQS